MSFRAEGNSVVRSTGDGEDVGVALTFSARTAEQIAEALNNLVGEEGLRLVTDPLTGDKVAQINVRDGRPLSSVLTDGSFVKVVGPYATAEMTTPDGRQIRSLAEGSVLPGDVTAGHARHLVDVGLAVVVEAGSAQEVYEGAPSQRHRVEAAAMTGMGPTVGTPAEGTAAYDYEQDPEAAARAAASGAWSSAPQLAVTGAGEAPLPDDVEDLGVPGGGRSSGKLPHGNANLQAWADYHVAQLVAGGFSEEDARAQVEGKSRDDIRALYK